LNIQAAYDAFLEQHGHVRDPAQEQVVGLLGELQRRLVETNASKSAILRALRLDRSSPNSIKGLYLWGGVGRGKTFLMDLFFETLEIEAKRRSHFHRIMQDVHRRLKELGDISDPLDTVARDIARESRVLCFDEFFVSDIGDAMILGRLLEGLFRRGVTLVATSNTRPDDLYREGLQRQRFLPAIAALNEHTRVVHMGGDTDYRLRLLREAGTYLTPDDAGAHGKLQVLFDESASSEIQEDHALDVNGRAIHVQRCAKGIAWFEFNDLCDGPRSQADYIEIARWYPTVILSGVPVLDSTLENQSRRFIALVDEFYDRRVKLIIAAEKPADGLYSGKRLRFEFERTVSRLIEMQSAEYLHLPHLP
jgi:cell division protein ZapE